MAGRIAYYGGVTSDGLVLALDAGRLNSYIKTGTTWSDISGYASIGTLINGPTFDSTNGGSIVFDGIDDYVRTNVNTALNLNGNYTISVWLKTTATTDKAIIQRYLSSGAFPGYAISLNRSTAGKVDIFTGGVWYTNKGTNVNSGAWVNIVFTVNGTSAVFYQNGTATSFTVNASNSNPSDNLFIGTTEAASNFFSGNISIIQIYNKALTANQVVQNYNSLKTRYISTITDSDVLAFITAAGITDSTQESAINTLVVSLKSYGIWTKMKAIYPFVGGTANSHKFNLKNPADSNAAFRLGFYGGMTHDSNGVSFGGTNGGASTYFNPFTNQAKNDLHLSVYARTRPTRLANANDINPTTFYNATGWTTLRATSNSSGYDYFGTSDTAAGVASLTTTAVGFSLGSRTSATAIKYYKNTTSASGNGASHTADFLNTELTLNGSNFSYYSAANYAFASLGNGLTDAEAANFYAAVQAFQTTLGRQV